MSNTPVPDEIVFVCSRGQHFTEMYLEMGMSMATMRFITEQDELLHNFEADISQERDLGLAFMDDDSSEQWPWYAEEPWEIDP